MNLRLTEKELAVIKKGGGRQRNVKKPSMLLRFGIRRCQMNKNSCLEGSGLILMEYAILKEYKRSYFNLVIEK